MSKRYGMWLLVLTLGLSIPARPLTIVGVGDIMLNGISAKRADLFINIAATLSKADIAFANLEVPLTNAKTRTPHKSAAAVAARNQFVLRADPAWAGPIARAGIDVVSIANNHAMDYGWTGVRQMTKALDDVGVLYSGAGGDETAAGRAVVVRARGVRVAFVSFLAFRGEGALAACGPAGKEKPGVNALRGGGDGVGEAVRARLSASIAAARRVADLVILSFHWGIERQTQPNDYQVAVARAAIDLGADAVLGHHPHVLQPYEVYAGKPIYYSLGNFVAPVCHGALGKSVAFEMTWQGRKLLGVKETPLQIVNAQPRLVAQPKTELDRMRKARSLLEKRSAGRPN